MVLLHIQTLWTTRTFDSQETTPNDKGHVDLGRMLQTKGTAVQRIQRKVKLSPVFQSAIHDMTTLKEQS